MRERLSCKIKRIWGFTLAEVLIVVGILAILAAVSFPALISMRNSLRQTELDETAKQIFITAQNKMSGMRLRGEDTADLGGVSLSATDDRTPSDMPESGAGPDSYALCDGAAGSEAEFSWMNDTAFAPSYVAADGGSYVIEYNGALGAVYGVYYWEGGGQAFQKKSTFEYPAHFNTYDGKELRGDANRKNRMTPSVGYYGGAVASAGADIRDLAFDLKVKNDARLELEITLDNGLYSEAAFDVTVSSRTESENKSAYVYSLRAGTVTAEPPEAGEQTAGSVWLCNPTDGAGSSTYTLTLDSLEGGLHFADNFKRIAAGDDLRITVTGYGAGGETVYIPQTRTVEINSLFAGVRGGADGDEVYLENGRHLQNLSYEVSGLGTRVDDTGREIVPEEVKQVRAAKLTRDIDWQAQVYDTAVGTQSYDAACTLRGAAGERVNFYPISNYTTGLVSFEGNNHRITGLHVTNYAEVFYEDANDGCGYAGMFGYMQDRGYAADKNPVNSIRDVTLVNPLVELEPADGVSAEQSCAGSLGGYLSTVWVENCRAYVESADAGETTAEKYEETGVKADCGYVGGLIGDASNLKASKSFASLKVAGGQNTGGQYIGGQYIGGFVGRVSYTDDGASEISMCYSGGSTADGVYIADKPNVSGQSGAMAVGGFAGLLDDHVTVERSFSTCSVKGTGDWTQVGAFVGRNGDGAAPTFEATYGMGTVFTEGSQTAGDIGCGTVEDAMAAGGRIAGSEASHPYDEFYRKDNTGYPCPVWLDAYYGDWSVSGEAVNGFVYYEVYRGEGEDGQDLYGFWSAADGAAGDDSLQNGSLRDDLPVISDGYGYLSESILDDASGKDKKNGVFVKQKDVPGAGVGNLWTLERIDVTVDGAAQYLYAFPWDGLTRIGTGEFETKQGQSPFYSCRELIIGDRNNGSTLKVYYNPHFAKAIGVNTGTEENPAVAAPENAVIRTARHLYELGENLDYWDSDWSYVQERDIDYEVYRPRKTYTDTTKKEKGNGNGNGNNTEPAAPESLSQGVIGNKKSEGEFKQTYDGGNHEIANLHMGSKDAPDTRIDLALFGYVGQVGVLEDIVLVRPVLIGGDSTWNAASLACVNGGTLSNVKVISPHIENRMLSAAGLVMDNTGTITDSFIIPEQKGVAEGERYLHRYNAQNEIEVNNYTNAYIAGAMNASGFVGNNSGTITGCGVAASVTASSDTWGGTAAGFVHTNSGTVDLSYANCYTAGKSGAAGFAYTTSGRITGCYALRRVTVMTPGGTVAGFAADGAGTISDSYAAVSVGYCPNYRAQPGGVITYENCVYDAAALSDITNHDMFIQFSGSKQTNCYYMDWAENHDVEGKGSSDAEGLSYTELCNLSVSGLQPAKADGSDTEVFSRTLPYVYPFPKAPDMIQYGDWPESGYAGAEMTYFEVYKEAGSNKYLLGFYNEMLDLDSLREDLPIFMDGYGLLFSADYVKMGDGALDDLIRGNTGDNRRAYVSWLDNRGIDSTTETHGLKNVYDMKDNAGADIMAGVYYKDAGGTEKEIEQSKDYVDTPISLKLNGRVNDYYFRILPAAATVTTAYVNSDSVYQELSIHETSAAYDELGGKAGRAIEKEQVFYYCPHFAKSAISKDEPPKGEPTSLTVRTPRQLSTLCYGNNMKGQNGITNYYDCSFVQERDINYGIDGPYAYYYVDEPMDDAGRGKPSSYRWFNSSIGSKDKPFTGSYDGGGHSIIGLGRWVGLERPFEENEAFTNADVPLFGVLSKSALISKTAVSGSRMAFLKNTEENPKGMLVGMVTEQAQLSGCAVKDSRVIVETSDVQCIGMAVGRMSGGTIDGLTLENIEMTAGGARRIGGAVGLIEGGSIKSVTASGVTIQADRAAGVVAGQIMSDAGDVSLSGIKLTGKISLTQMTASNKTEIWDGVGLIAGLCEVGNHSVDVGDIEIAAADDTAPITVTSATGSRFYVAGLVFGTVYPTKQATGTLSLGAIGVHGARLLMNTPSGQKVCSYGGLAGAVGNESLLRIESSKEITWDFSGSRIEVSSDKDNHYNAASGVAGLIGNVKKDVELTLPGKVILPDVSVKVQPGHSIPVSGVANNTSGASMALRSPEGSHSDICLGDITTENCDNTGGVTAVLTDKTTLGELLVSGLSGKGTIRASGNAGGIAGTVDVTNTETALLRNLSVSGIKITGAGNLGGFAGLVRSGAVRQCFANAEVTAAYPAASGAGGFVGAIDTAVGGTVSAPAVTITDCYASGAVHADGAAAAGQPQPQSDLKAGGFFGEAVSKSKMTVSGCYSTGDVTVTEANAAAKSAVGGFGGRIADDSDASVTGCYSLGKVAEKAAGMSTNLSAGGFVGYMPSASGQPTTEIRQPETVDSMLQSMIRILKNAEIHNRIPSQNGKTCWEINNITMDSDTRGIFDYEKNPATGEQYEFSAMVYNVLGYPKYTDMLKNFADPVTGRAPTGALVRMYNRFLFDGNGEIKKPDDDQDYQKSYYNTFYEPSLHYNLMRRWSIQNGGYFYWVNSTDVGSVKGYRINLKDYDEAVTGKQSLADRIGMIETGKVTVGQKTGSYKISEKDSPKNYIAITDVGNSWGKQETGILSDCCFLREDGTTLPAYNQRYTDGGGAKLWTVADFSQELQREAANSGRMFPNMQPDSRSASAEFTGYPYPMIKNCGAGINEVTRPGGLAHDGEWPDGYHPVFTPPQP